MPRERKHIKIRGVLSTDRTKVLCDIIEQTHFGDEFGSAQKTHKVSGYKTMSFRYKDICLYSAPYGSTAAATLEDSRGRGRLDKWLSFPSDPNRDKHFDIPVKYWKLIKEAVDAYNKWGDSAED